MKSKVILAFVTVWALGLSPVAWAGEFLDTPEVQEQLAQIHARAAQIHPALPAESVQSAVSRAPDSPVNFRFNPDDVKGKEAVVLSVCGVNFGAIGVGGFQADMLFWLYHRIFPDKKVDGKTARQIFQAVQALSAQDGTPDMSDLERPDDYLENVLRDQLSGAGKKVLVVPMPWTRNPQKSDAAIADFKAWLALVYDAAQKNGKPVYVVAHSWGTLLMYEALEGLAKDGSPIRVDKFVTMGSPLVPSQWWVKLFVKLEEHFQGMEQKVVKPANVKTWVNFWAKRDAFSNSIPAADGGNFRVDAPADVFAEIIVRALFKPIWAIQKLAAKDWTALNSIGSWHAAYMFGYHKSFPSIKQQADIDVFGPEILPKL